MPASSSTSTKRAAMVGESLDGFRMTVFQRRWRRTYLAMMAREIPGGNDRAYASGCRAVGCARRELDRRCCFRDQRFAGVEPEEVDGLGYVGVGLSPVLPTQVTRAEFKLTLAVCAAFSSGARFDGRVLPRRIGFMAAFMAFSARSRRLSADADDLRRLRWIARRPCRKCARSPPMISPYS